MLSLILPSLALLLSTSSRFGVQAAANDSCAVCDDVHFFLARGNNEPYPGRQGMLVEATCDGLSSCGYENLYYSALYTDLYCQTVYDGAIAGHVQMTAYAEKCPNSKIILAGYSQGAQIAGDIIGGGGGTLFNGCVQPTTPPINKTTSPGNQIAAVIVFGDVRHTANLTYDYGNGSAIDGWFPRTQTQLANLAPYADIMRNWCVSSDPICAAHQPMSSYNEEAHLDYYDVDSDAAASWIKSVASLTNTDASFTTSIATSYSGTVQNYATIGTATPSGTVQLDTTWTDMSSYAPCTASSYTSKATSTFTGATTDNSMANSPAPTAAPTGGAGVKGKKAQTGTATGTADTPEATNGASSSFNTAARMGALAVVVQLFMFTR